MANIKQNSILLELYKLLLTIRGVLRLCKYKTSEELCECYPEAVKLGLISDNGINIELIRSYLSEICRVYQIELHKENERNPNSMGIILLYSDRLNKARKTISLVDSWVTQS